MLSKTAVSRLEYVGNVGHRALGCRTLCGLRGSRASVALTKRLSLAKYECPVQLESHGMSSDVLVRSVVPASMMECYLVDPASSHMLVSKIKPCMCKYELIQTVKLRMAH